MAPTPLLHNLPPIEPPSHLFEQVLNTIESARVRALYGRMAFVFSALALTIGYAWTHLGDLLVEISTSSFVEFLRLSFSDPDIVLANTKDVALGLLESLPTDFLLTLLISSTLAVGLVYLLQMIHSIRRHNTSPLTTHLF